MKKVKKLNAKLKEYKSWVEYELITLKKNLNEKERMLNQIQAELKRVQTNG